MSVEDFLIHFLSGLGLSFLITYTLFDILKSHAIKKLPDMILNYTVDSR